MKFWTSWPLAHRTAMLFALVACLVMASLGMYLYSAARQALEMRADYTLIGRVEHFRNLFHDLYDVKQMEERPALFESMLGNEQDVRIFRHMGEPPFIHVNPGNMTPPDMTPVGIGMPLTPDALHEGTRPDGVRVRWVSALAEVGEHNDKVEIIAAYVMTQESKVLSSYLLRVIVAVALTVLLTTALGFAILRRGLRPLQTMGNQADEITPANLSARLLTEDAPPELRKLADAFNAMLDRLEAGFEHLSQFSGDLAHEIRTPVNILMGQTQVTLGQPRRLEEYEQVLESNLEELARLSRIIENILFLANTDHATLAVERVDIPLEDELSKVADYFEGIAEERELHFEQEAAGSSYANLVMWRRAVNNLVINAVRYGKSGTAIKLRASANGQGSTIIVENQCDLISQEHLGSMFNRFYRGDKSRNEFTESNGLGLSIVKAIMSLHGGNASVSYSEQHGTISFRLDFPAAG
ncbi:heavy metal sensor histidine kinase [Undibacterium sp.]|uniref:heavy metal sensor histidine kinase n=1 Tax=Undibacterium sp. TaxID=1914977 RepID=UPI00374D285D